MGNYNVEIKVVKASSSDKSTKANLPSLTCANTRCCAFSYRCSRDCQ